MASYRRQILDKDLEKSKQYMKGIVLDIGGGRRRGSFEKPIGAIWIRVDIIKKLNPHVVADAQNIPIKSNSIDCVKCTELLEHVESPENVLTEVARVLKPGGALIISMPFNFQIHGDPYDFQRYTDKKLIRLLEDNFEIISIKKQGLFFTVLAQMIQQALLNSGIRFIFYPIYQILNQFIKLDDLTSVRNSTFYSSFATGFFVIAKKELKK